MLKKDKMPKKRRVSITMLMPYLVALDDLIEAGVYSTRGEIVHEALRRFLKDYGVELPRVEKK